MNNPRVSRRKEILKIRAEINAKETTQETWIQSLDWDDTLKKKMAIHFSTENPGGIASIGSQRAGHDLTTKQK